MNILIPIDKDKNLCSMQTNQAWILANLDEGKLKSTKEYKTKDDIEEFFEYVVVISKDEYISEFIIEGIGVLVAPMQRSLEEIVEAYMFRELYEVSQ